MHELIEAEPGEAPAHPHENEDDDHRFAEDDDRAKDADPELGDDLGIGGVRIAEQVRPGEVDPGDVPSAEKERDADHAGGDHSGIFAQEKEGEFETGIFNSYIPLPTPAKQRLSLLIPIIYVV